MTKEEILNQWLKTNKLKAERAAMPAKLIQYEQALLAATTCKCPCHVKNSHIMCFVGCCAGAGKTIQTWQKEIIKIKETLSSYDKI